VKEHDSHLHLPVDVSPEISTLWRSRGNLERLAGKIEAAKTYSLSAVPRSAQAFCIKALADTRHKTTLVIADNVKTQEEIANDFDVWEVPYLFIPQIENGRLEGVVADPEIVAEQLNALEKIQTGFEGVVLVSAQGASQILPQKDTIREGRLLIKVGHNIARDELIERLEAAGYFREGQVSQRGTYSIRGAILDIFSWSSPRPLRTEWDGDSIISIREFDFINQRSLCELDQHFISLVEPRAFLETDADGALLKDYLPSDTVIFHLGERTEAVAHSDEDLQHEMEFFAHDFLHTPAGDVILQEKRKDLFLDHLKSWRQEHWTIAFFCNNEGEQKRLGEILEEAGEPTENFLFFQKPLLRGFAWPAGKLVVLSDAEIFGRYQTLRMLRKQERLLAMRARQSAVEFSEYAEGDYVVHLNHGIALYAGLRELPGSDGGAGTEVLALEFAEGGRLYVPVEQAYLVSKYVGIGKQRPKLDVLGGSRWERARSQARKAVMDYAAELLKIQAERNTMEGHAFGPDNEWQKKFEESFIFEETPDQIKAITETKQDMEARRPMERLICGDVGFGKTEVAIRAIFKSVMEGKQAAFLVPTTVLAQQHYQTLKERFADYPITVEMLSRFRTPRQQEAIIQDLKSGRIDVVIGTHRLISEDVVFKDLGLVVIDEEQRFGVRQKEKFKQRFRLIDVLTLSATPIPRTLYLALTGARDLSVIETPPRNRLAVETVVAAYDERLIRDAIERELERKGQVYFLHNRIASIHEIARRIKALVPKAKVDIGHGQMDEEELEQVMARFVAGETDVLLSTTIIESGLDIPNANTIIIDRADQFGLADLYQLRGRVGRAHHKAYAFLLMPRHLMTVADARKRVNAIKQYSHLGAGFKIAMRDLEIRGAGNILGTAQSGHITAVGFDLYCQLLKKAVSQIKGEKNVRLVHCRLDLDFLVWQESLDSEATPGAYLPRSYIPGSQARIEAYRKLAELTQMAEASDLFAEWKDRFGPFPEPVKRLAMAAEIRIAAEDARISLIETDNDKLIMKRGQDYIMVGGKFPRLTQKEPLSRLHEIKQWIESVERPAPTTSKPEKKLTT
jgi:transcription-repair coupling factor (superfamily II helicase)